jgi:recombination protein RecT
MLGAPSAGIVRCIALPPELADHLNLTEPPVPPRPSATVLLMRDGTPWELLLVHRPGGADFAPGAYVFPGGAVHEDDHAWDDEIRGAAVRELFEEAGILMARSGRGFATDSDCEEVRKRTERGSSFSASLREVGVEPVLDDLVLFARWVTPAQLRRRFDARFYLARMPEGQTVRPQEGEVTDWRWIAPQKALDDPEITLVYATRAVLESVAQAPNARALFERALRLNEIPIIEPRIVPTDVGWRIER